MSHNKRQLLGCSFHPDAEMWGQHYVLEQLACWKRTNEEEGRRTDAHRHYELTG